MDLLLLEPRIDRLLAALDRIADASERTATACEALATHADLNDEAVPSDEPPNNGVQPDINIDALG